MDERIRPFLIEKEPYYREAGNEVALFSAAVARGLPMMLKGPTGCGKTRFVEHMAWRLKLPLITMACNEDMTASDLVGRWLLDSHGTVWHDGPLTIAVRYGAICYLDEVVEARQDTTVVIHPLTDDRRMLPLDKGAKLSKLIPTSAWWCPTTPDIKASQRISSRPRDSDSERSTSTSPRRESKPMSLCTRHASSETWPLGWCLWLNSRALCEDVASTRG